MPFPIVHLLVARELLAHVPAPAELPQWYLGAVAPDAVHFRSAFTPASKCQTHLCPPGWIWAQSKELADWRRSVLAFYAARRGEDEPDFWCGYCAHALLDVLWGAWMWLPFVEAQGTQPVYGQNAMQSECRAIDTELYHRYDAEQVFFPALRDARVVNLPGVVEIGELARQRESLIHEQFVNRPVDTAQVYTCITPQQMMDLVPKAAAQIADWLLNS